MVRPALVVGAVSLVLASIPGSPLFVWGQPERLTAALSGLWDVPVEARAVLLGLLAPVTALHCWNLVQEWRRLDRETLALGGCRAGVAGAGGESEAPLSPAQAEGWLAEADPRGGLRRAVTALFRCRDLSTCPLEEILALVGETEFGRGSSSRAAPNQVMILGLLGTVVGLGGVVGTLAYLVAEGQAGQADAVWGNVQETLQKMGTAFSCTAWGILGATALAWGNGAVHARRARLVSEVETMLVTELVPRVLPKSNAWELSDLRSAVHETSTAIRDQVQAFQAAVGQAHAASQQQVRGLQEALEGTSQSANNQIAALRGGIEAADQARDRQLETLRGVLKQTYDLMQNVENVCTGIAVNYHGALDGVGRAILDGAQALREVTISFDQATRNADNRTHQAAGHLTEAIEAFERNLGGLTQAATRMEDATVTQNTLLEKWVQDQHSLTTQITDEQSQLTQRVGQQLGRALEAQTQALHERMAAEQALAERQQELTTQLSQLTMQVEALARQLGVRVEASRAAWERAAGAPAPAAGPAYAVRPAAAPRDAAASADREYARQWVDAPGYSDSNGPHRTGADPVPPRDRSSAAAAADPGPRPTDSRATGPQPYQADRAGGGSTGPGEGQQAGGSLPASAVGAGTPSRPAAPPRPDRGVVGEVWDRLRGRRSR